MMFSDEELAKKLINKSNNIQSKIDELENEIRKLNNKDAKIHQQVQTLLLIKNFGTYILDDLICDNENNITKYVYEYAYSSWGYRKFITYPEYEANNYELIKLNYLKKIFEISP